MTRILTVMTLVLLSTTSRADEAKPKVDSADNLLTSGLAAAKKNGKAVFLAFGSPGCGWCKYLEKFHERPAVAETLGKQIVLVKVDVVENAGGQQMYDKYVARPSGVPVWLFLSADGKVLADSFAEGKKTKENVGFPYEPSEVAHYEKALRASLPKLSDSDITVIMKELKEAGPKKKE